MTVLYKAKQALEPLGIFAEDDLDELQQYDLKFAVGKGMVTTKFSQGKPWFDGVAQIVKSGTSAWVMHVIEHAKECGMGPNLSNKVKFVPSVDVETPVPSLPPVESKVTSGAVQHLVGASSMYSPVHGTSANSVYFMVGNMGPIKIAARYVNETLSIRVEGSEFQKYLPWLKEAGFKSGESHASMHLKAPTKVMASRALGAVMADLNDRFGAVAPIPKISVIAGKGA